MNDKVLILAGLIAFLALATFPFWYAPVAGGDAAPPDLERPTDGSCVESKEWMIANHMTLLNEWRDAVVRKGETEYTSTTGETHVMSLTGTCMKCHTSRENFCTKCHEYANVLPPPPLKEIATARKTSRGVRCWHCHREPKGD